MDEIESDIRTQLSALVDGVWQAALSLASGALGEPEALTRKQQLADACAGQIVDLFYEDEPENEPEDQGEDALSLLTGFGVEPLTAQHLAQQCSLAQIAGWIAYAQAAKSLTNPAGLVVSRLRAGVPAPKLPDDRRYTTGKYAAFIQH